MNPQQHADMISQAVIHVKEKVNLRYDFPLDEQGKNHELIEAACREAKKMYGVNESIILKILKLEK